MSANTQSTISFAVTLYFFANLALFVLKLAGVTVVASWSWWAVTALLWLPWALALGFLGVVMLVRTIQNARS